MKLPLIAALAASVVLSAAAARADFGSTVSVRVEQANKVESPKGDRYTKTQKRSLKIYLTNSSQQEVNLKVKYAFYGHGTADHELVTLDSGDKDATVKPAGDAEVDTPEVTATSVEKHQAGSSAKGGGKPVPASGNIFRGYSVQVFLADALVAEAYDPPSMKDEVGKAAAAKAGPKATPAKK